MRKDILLEAKMGFATGRDSFFAVWINNLSLKDILGLEMFNISFCNIQMC